MQNDNELIAFNNAVANKTVTWWELQSSQPGHDMDELFLQFSDGTSIKISAEHREYGAALRVAPLHAIPLRAVRNITLPA